MPSPLPGSNAKMHNIQSKLNALTQGIQGNTNKLAQNVTYGGPPVVGPPMGGPSFGGPTSVMGVPSFGGPTSVMGVPSFGGPTSVMGGPGAPPVNLDDLKRYITGMKDTTNKYLNRILTQLGQSKLLTKFGIDSIDLRFRMTLGDIKPPYNTLKQKNIQTSIDGIIYEVYYLLDQISKSSPPDSVTKTIQEMKDTLHPGGMRNEYVNVNDLRAKLTKLLDGLKRRGSAIVNKLNPNPPMRSRFNGILSPIYSKLGILINNIQPPTTSEAFHTMMDKSQQEIMTLVESFINKINNTTLPPGVDLQKDIQDLRNFFTKGDTGSPGDTSAALLSTIRSFPTGPSSTAAVLSAIASFPTGPSSQEQQYAANLSTMAALSGQPSTGFFPTDAAIESRIKSFGGPSGTPFMVDPSISIKSFGRPSVEINKSMATGPSSQEQQYAANLSTMAAFDQARAMAALSGQPSVVYRPTGAAIDRPAPFTRASGPSPREQMYANLNKGPAVKMAATATGAKKGGYRYRASRRSHKGSKGSKGSKGRRSHKGHKGSKNKTHKGRKH